MSQTERIKKVIADLDMLIEKDGDTLTYLCFDVQGKPMRDSDYKFEVMASEILDVLRMILLIEKDAESGDINGTIETQEEFKLLKARLLARHKPEVGKERIMKIGMWFFNKDVGKIVFDSHHAQKIQ